MGSELRHQALSPLPADFPIPEASGVHSNLAISTWVREYGEWREGVPPEDIAVPLVLAWTEQHRELVLRSLAQHSQRTLDDEEEHAMSWPPRPFLATPGGAFEGTEWCFEHGDDPEPQCEECAEVTEIPDKVEPAIWEWYVDLETWKRNPVPGSMSLADSSPIEIMRTEMDPRLVRYRSEPW